MRSSNGTWLRTLALAICAIVLAVINVSSAYAQALSSGNRYQGIMSAIWGDPKPGVQTDGGMRFSLVYPDGTRVPLNFAPQLQSAALQYIGKRVVVQGSISQQAGPGGGITVDAIEEVKGALSPTTSNAATTGTRRVLFILLRFRGDTQMPHPASFFTKLTNPLTAPATIGATINGFFNKVSYGKFKWAADVAGVGGVGGTRWLTLPHARTFYANCNASSACADLNQIGDDAVALVKNAGVDVTVYSNINFVLNNDLDCCAWGGSYSDGVRSWGATWEPPWGQETSTYVHEMGHSLGLPHSGWRYYAYDSHHDEMSRGNPAKTVQCGTYNSALFGGPNTSLFCNEPGAGYIMAHQDFLGWIPLARKATHSTISVKGYVIEANSMPLSNRLKMVKVCITGRACTGAPGTAARFLTIEVKMHAGQYDNGVPSEGVIIHDVQMNRANTIGGPCYFNSQNGWAVPFDSTPGDFNPNTCSPQDQVGTGLLNMAYGVGKSFNSPALGIKIDVVSTAAQTYTVRVTKTK